MSLADVLAACPEVTRPGATKHEVRCPAHEDHQASLSLREVEGGKVLAHCHAGCSFGQVQSAFEARGVARSAWGTRSGKALRFRPPPSSRTSLPRAGTDRPADISPNAQLVETYEYCDLDDRPLFRVERYEPKSFRQSRALPDGGWAAGRGDLHPVLYRWSRVVEQAATGGRIFLVEGEKDVHALERLGVTATTVPGGAQSWAPTFAAEFAGADVVIVPDNDPPGQKFAQAAADDLVRVASMVRIVCLPDLPLKGDVSDWIEAGGRIEAMETLVQSTRPFGNERLYPASQSQAWIRASAASFAPIIPEIAYRGRVTLLSAREKMGKSTFLSQLAAAVTRGDHAIGRDCQAGAVVWYGIDEHPADALNRLERDRADLERVYLHDERPTPTEMERQLSTCPHASLVVVDTLSELWGIEDDSDARSVQRGLRPYVDAIRRSGAAGVFLYHTPKSSKEYRGSTAIGAIVDAPLTFAPPSSGDEDSQDGELIERRRVISGKTRWGDVHVRLRMENGLYQLDTSDRRLDLYTDICALLEFDSVSATDIQQTLKRRRQTILDALKRLREAGIVSDVDGRRLRVCPGWKDKLIVFDSGTVAHAPLDLRQDQSIAA